MSEPHEEKRALLIIICNTTLDITAEVLYWYRYIYRLDPEDFENQNGKIDIRATEEALKFLSSVGKNWSTFTDSL